MTKPLMNLDDVEFDDVEKNGLFTSSRTRISDRIGARKLDYDLTVLPPGKAQCPFHRHHGDEKCFSSWRAAANGVLAAGAIRCASTP